MADNVTAEEIINAGQVFAADVIGGVAFVRNKLILGADGVNDGDVCATNPMPVTGTIAAVTAITNPLPAGTNVLGHIIIDAGTAAIGKLAANSGVTIGAVEIAAAQTLGTVTTVGTVTTITNVVHVDDNGGSLTIDGTVAISGTVTVGSHAVTNAGTFAVQAAGDVASGSADSGSPVKQGFAATTSQSGLTLVSDAQRVNGRAGVDGIPIVRPNTNLEDIVTGTGSATGTSNTSVVGAQGAGVKFYLTDLCISNSSATAVEVTLIDDVAGANTSKWGPFPVPANTSGVVKSFVTPIPFSANKAAGFVSSSGVTTIKVSFAGFKSKI